MQLESLNLKNPVQLRTAISGLWHVVSTLNKSLQMHWDTDTREVSVASNVIYDKCKKISSNIIDNIIMLIAEKAKVFDITFDDKKAISCIVISKPISYIFVAKLIFGKMLSSNEFLDLARDAIKRKYRIDYNNDAIRDFSMLATSTNHLSKINVRIDRKELRNQLAEKTNINKLIVNAFIEILLLDRVLFIPGDDPRKIIRKGEIYYFYLINKFFGIKFDIPGLNFLFEEGLLVPSPGGLPMLIEGGPGAGKTTLALQMGKEIAKDGGCCIYFTAEQEVESINRLIVSFNWQSDFWVDINTDISSLNEVLKKEHDGKGLLLIRGITKWSFEDTSNAIRKTINQLDKYKWKKKSLVIDSINAFDLNENENDEEHPLKLNNFIDQQNQHKTTANFTRNKIEALIHIIRQNNYLGMLIGEIGYRDEMVKISEYLSDVVVKLEIGEDEQDYAIRQISIKKCRAQHIQRGHHHFSIQRQSGIEIYPSCSAVLDARRGRKRTELHEQNIIFPKIDKFSELVNTNILRNSVTAIVGSPGTGKSILAMCMFLSPDNFNYGDLKQRYLILSFGEDESATLKKIKSISSIYQMYQKKKKENIEICHIIFRPGYCTSGQIITRILGEISESKSDGEPITRVLIDDLAQIPQKFPLLRKQSMFLPTLVEILNTEDITSFMSFSLHKTNTINIEMQIRTLCNYLFTVKNIINHENREPSLVLSVTKSVKQNHVGNAKQLCINNESIQLMPL